MATPRRKVHIIRYLIQMWANRKGASITHVQLCELQSFLKKLTGPKVRTAAAGIAEEPPCPIICVRRSVITRLQAPGHYTHAYA